MVARVSGPSDALVKRHVLDLARESLGAFRVLVIHGARQVGKTTLALELGRELGADYVTLDDDDEMRSATTNSRDFLAIRGRPLVIDEVQRAGQPLVLAVKVVVDNDNRPGQFILTGSTNFLTVPTISESLAGRVDIVTLWPLSQGELSGGAEDFVDRAFEAPGELARRRTPVPERDAYFKALCVGGFPSVQSLGERLRRRWFNRYVETVLQREVAVADDIRRADVLAGLVRYFAATTGQELVMSNAAERLKIDRSTVAAYELWLETVFLVHRLPAWSRNLAAKVVRRPKIYISDSGLGASLLGKDPNALRRPTDPASGPLFESFVVGELRKQLGWSEVGPRMYHFRDRGGAEVDVILEAPDGRVVAIEIKSTSTPRPEDFRWLEFVRHRVDRAGGEFVAGVVLHTGERRLPFGDRMVALPAADVWT
jgi:predicted AAA+ superfamily ATPase